MTTKEKQEDGEEKQDNEEKVHNKEHDRKGKTMIRLKR